MYQLFSGEPDRFWLVGEKKAEGCFADENLKVLAR
jgi:hypothetical protein